MRTSPILSLGALLALSVVLSGYPSCEPIEPQGVFCEYGGVRYEVGDEFPAGDACNTCFCDTNGLVACTEIACEMGCEYGDSWYEVGESFPALDGCNTCFCGEGGSVACTEMACWPAARLAGGGHSFGMCWGACRGDLTLEGRQAFWLRSGWDDTIYADNAGTLTPTGLAAAEEIALALADVALDDVYGCPDCADGGAAYVLLERDGQQSRHAYEFAAPPDVLAAADAFLADLMAALDGCEATEHLVPADDCEPLQEP